MSHITKSTQKHTSILFAIILFVASLMFLPVFVHGQTYSKNTTYMLETGVSKIIKRANELVPMIEDTAQRAFIGTALAHMAFTTVSGTRYSTIPERDYYIVIAPSTLIGEQDDGKEHLMRLDSRAYTLQRKFVVLVSEDLDSLYGDLDFKAVTLMHDLLHGMQVKAMVEAGMDPETTARSSLGIVLEREGWILAASIYFRLHSEVLNNIAVNCETVAISVPPEIRDNHGVLVLLMFHECGDKYLRKVYSNLK